MGACDLEIRIGYVEAFAEELRAHREALAEVISIDTAKPLWESRTEVDAMIGKVPTSIQAHRERHKSFETDMAGVHGHTYYKPHGTLAVFGPFNLPGHLPNGHIVPALLAGNTVVHKPSEQAPSVAAFVLQLWHDAQIPPGVINLVQGSRDTGEAIVRHRQLDGLLFTGSFQAGRAIHQALADEPGKIVALEMGGNNPLIVHRVTDIEAAAYGTVLSAFITAGQRCTCARRLIVPVGRAGDRFLARFVELADKLRLGDWREAPPPFMGPVISASAAERALAAQQNLLDKGGVPLLAMALHNSSRTMLSPGVVDVTQVTDRSDEEIFAPLLQVIRTSDFESAVREANDTAYGLAAGLFSDDADLFDYFFRHIRAGVVNWNRQTTGASGKLPFGGIGRSGNHRPSGYFATDYCTYPVASLQQTHLNMPEHPLPGVMS